ncbi:winged helix-turn-helix domain-containing protein [Sphingomonas sp. S2-65]|uniref:winged helix-turn-helix domain-containing protein n=1 Tax=Sphingomonas sp. S2-65 TaxID=2903960 RepID=UPI001F3A47A6|nr:winged helix-turn-helix domain-containing protein [Sphingomonas sp. S2-65]UYY58417.1 winged helix-turn-helix domain-containing protein [Sphingomonas sp. S2-65]
MYRSGTSLFTTPPSAPIRPSHFGRVLVIDEDARMRDTIIDHLRDRDWAAIGCGQRDVTRHLQSKDLSLIALHARLETTVGLDMLRQIRGQSHVPVVLYGNDLGDGVTRIVALELGADDVLCGPLNPHEFLARARAILRRQELGRLVVQPRRGGYRFDGWELRHATRELRSPQGELVPLTKKEYALLGVFLGAPGRPLSRVQLMHGTRADEDIFDRSIDVQVLRLRRKLQTDPSAPQLIRTERGFGYTLNATVEPLF